MIDNLSGFVNRVQRNDPDTISDSSSNRTVTQVPQTYTLSQALFEDQEAINRLMRARV
jgi:hypothetical protein